MVGAPRAWPRQTVACGAAKSPRGNSSAAPATAAEMVRKRRRSMRMSTLPLLGLAGSVLFDAAAGWFVLDEGNQRVAGVRPASLDKGLAMVDARDVGEIAAIELLRREQASTPLPTTYLNLVGLDTLTGADAAATVIANAVDLDDAVDLLGRTR